MRKEALDLSFLYNMSKPIGSGTVGSYYGDFNAEEIQKIKDKVGLRSHDTGIKVTSFKTDAIGENLSLYFIMPYIEEMTNIKTPKPQMPLTLKTLTEEAVFTQHIKGVHLHKVITDWGARKVAEDITGEHLRYKLRQIGIIWTDAHSGNYMIDPRTSKEKIDNILNPPQPDESFDFSDYVTIVDVGYFKCGKETPPGKKLTLLMQKLEAIQNKRNYGPIYKIINEIENMLK